MKGLKKALQEALAAKRSDYTQPIIIIVDTSLTRIGWVIGQVNKEGNRHPI
jgi:hypothetical protein